MADRRAALAGLLGSLAAFLARPAAADTGVIDRACDLVVMHQTDGLRWRRTPIDAERVSPLLQRLLTAMPA